LRAREAIKKVLHKCFPCTMARNPHCRQIEDPLPADRVQPQKPFAVTGIDFDGPLYIKMGSNMRQGYIALFTCANTRAVHLEVCTDMTTDKCLAGISAICGKTGTATHRLHGHRTILLRHQQTPGSIIDLSVRSQNSPISRS
jgi:hypothetical protein